MLTRLIRFSLERPSLILVMAAALLIYAGAQFSRTPVDVFPELNAPTVVVMTESPGLAADEVEQYVTFPIETALNGISGVRRVRSSSAIGLSIAFIEFDWGSDIYRARQLVSERLDTVREELPPDAHVEMTPITSITGEIMLLAVSSPDGTVNDLDLRSYAQYDLRNRLLAIPGVAQISVIGGELAEYQVLVQQEKLRLYDLTVQDVAEAAGASHSTLAAGYLPNVEGFELPIRQSGKVRSVADVAGTVIKYHDGAPVTIGEVATVRLGPALRRGTGADAGHPAVILTVQKAPGTNTLVITGDVDTALDDIEKSMPAGIELNRQIFRQSDFILLSVDNIVHALRDASIIVTVLLVIFLVNIRTTFITLVAIPLSLAFGLVVLGAMNMTINVMTLGGFAIAVGSLIDDAIIGTENAFRRLRQNTALPEEQRLSKREVVFKAIEEIRPSIVFATIIIAIVFLPLFFLAGIEGRFFRPLGIAFIVSIMASLAVALTITPVLCRYLLGGRSVATERDGFVVRCLKAVYEPSVRLALRYRWAVLAAALAVTGGSLWLGSTFGRSFLPEFNEGTFTVFLMAPPGTSLETSDRLAQAMDKRLLEVEGVRSVTRRTGRAERDEHAEPVSNSELEITVAPGYRRNEVRARIADILDDVPGITTSIGQPIEHRLSHILSGTPAAIAINVYGDDLARLRAIAKEIEASISSVPGARDVTANREVMIQSLPVNYRPRDLAAYGLTPQDAAQQVRDAIYGVTVAEINEGVRRYDLTVRLDESERGEVRDLRRLVLRGVGGA
ncbi:MAG: efflux RND transporter permease subunit, partial [Planctomycetota bacterium]